MSFTREFVFFDVFAFSDRILKFVLRNRLTCAESAAY